MERFEHLAARLHRWLEAHRRPVLALWALLATLGAVGAARLEPRQEVLTLLEGVGGGAYRGAARDLERFGTLDVLLLDLSRPDASEAELGRAAAELEDRLAHSGDFRRVLFRIDRAGMKRAAQALFEKRFFVLPPPAPGEIAAAIEAARRDLLSPAGLMIEEAVARDPLDQRARIVARLRGLAPRMRLDASTGMLFSTDHRHALLVAEPFARGLDVAAGQQLLARLRAAAPPGFTLEILGAHVFADAAARAIRRDVWSAVAGTVVVILALFFAYFRDLRPVLALFLPVVAGGLIAAGLCGWTRYSLHGITFGFGAVMLGMGVDYGAYLLIHAAGARGRVAPPGEPGIRTTYARISGSVAMAAATTLASFAVLLVPGARVLDELTIFTGIGIFASYLFAMTALPLVTGALGRAASGAWPATPPADLDSGTGCGIDLVLRPGNRWPVAVLVAAGILTLGLGAELPRLRFDGSVRNLDWQPDDVRALEARFGERYDNPRHAALLVAAGPTREAALEASDHLLALLTGAGPGAGTGTAARPRALAFSSPSEILPSERTQRANLAAYDPLALEAQVDAAARAAGIDPATFVPFFADLARARSGGVAPLTEADLAGTPVEPLLRRSIIAEAEATRVLTIAYADALPIPLTDALATLGVTVVSGERLASATVRWIEAAIERLALASLAFVMIVLLGYYRRWTPIAFALTPALLGLGWAFGLMALVEVPLNIVSVGALALVSGVGVDYGIFMTDAAIADARGARGETATAVRVVTMAAAANLIGFGSLLVARSPAMWSLGFGVSAGISASYLAAVLVLPAIWRVSPPGGLVAPRCPRCGRPLRRGSRRARIAAGLIAGLAVALFAAWLRGLPGAPHSPRVLVLLALDGAALAALAVKMARAPRSCRRRSCGQSPRAGEGVRDG